MTAEIRGFDRACQVIDERQRVLLVRWGGGAPRQFAPDAPVHVCLTCSKLLNTTRSIKTTSSFSDQTLLCCTQAQSAVLGP
eukprot:3939330-Rhodomonas_salina.1